MKIREITASDVNIKPKCYEDSPIVWTLNHFENLRIAFETSVIENLTLTGEPDLQFRQKNLTRTLCEAMIEFTFLLGQLDFINLDKSNYKSRCDYKVLISKVYIEKDETELAYKVGRTHKGIYKYSYSTKIRDIRFAAYYLNTIITHKPEYFKHLTEYMKNIK